MKRIATSIVTVARACLGMAVDAKAATDRAYTASISPQVVTTSAPVPYLLTVTNDIKNGSNHFIRDIVVTVPSAFALVNLTGTSSPVTPPPLWKVVSITGAAGAAHVITFNTINSSDASMTAGKSVTFVINAQAASATGNCGAAQTYTWTLYV